ncbi:LPS export ABC transporter permease LptF [Candidatus Electronema sp. PJ]|uniref:LPS export ABC transporter permease LptF n=1 Tax=Candidatus Electronema sp. PJ TaxID=3401572 RepID=UPI003AA9D03E
MLRKRLPLLLYSYLTTELLAPFFASFLILYSVFFLVRLIPLLEIVLDLGIGLADFIRLFSYIFPHLLLYVIPMASMTGVIIGFTRLTNDRELLALKACGISLRQMLPPVVLLASVIATLTGWFSVRLIPAGEVAIRQLMYQLAKEKIDKGIKEKKFTEALGEVVVYVDETKPDTGAWQGVYVSDMRGRQQPNIIMAKSGQMQADISRMAVTIILHDGTLHSTSGFDGQTVRFRRYQLRIPLKPPTKIDGDDVTQLSKSSMSQEQLLTEASRPNAHPQDVITFMSEYHHRLAMPVGCLILSLLGLPLGLQAGPGRKAIGLPLGLFFFVLYYMLSTVGQVMAEDKVLPVPTGLWLSNAIFSVLVLFVFRRTEQERPVVPEPVTLAGRWLLEGLLVRPYQRLAARLHRKPARQLQTTLSGSAGLLVHADPDTGLFHLPGCQMYRRAGLQFVSIKVAQKAGFSPCPHCEQRLTNPHA